MSVEPLALRAYIRATRIAAAETHARTINDAMDARDDFMRSPLQGNQCVCAIESRYRLKRRPLHSPSLPAPVRLFLPYIETTHDRSHQPGRIREHDRPFHRLRAGEST